MIYPLIEIIFGVYRLYPKIKYLPFRIHLLDLLTNLSKETGIYIPIIADVLDTLKLNMFTKKIKRQRKQKTFEIYLAFKISKSEET